MESKKEFVNSSLPYLPVTHRAAGQTMDSPAPKSSFAQELKGAAETSPMLFDWLLFATLAKSYYEVKIVLKLPITS